MKFQLQENDLGLLAIKDLDDDTGLLISATYPSHQAGLTPDQAHLIAAATLLFESGKNALVSLKLWANKHPNDEVPKTAITQLEYALDKVEGK